MLCMRDPWEFVLHIYHYDDEIAAVASERPVIQTVMNVKVDDVNEIRRRSFDCAEGWHGIQ